MATPSLAMIPSAYADSKVYSVLPNNGDGDFTFNRDSSATRVGSNGLIQTVGFFGNELILSTMINTSYNTFNEASSSGFHAINTAGTSQRAGTVDEIIFVTGKIYTVNIDVSVVSGIAPFFRARQAIATSPVLFSGQLTDGNNVITFTSTDTLTGVLEFSNADAAEYRVSNVSVKEVTGDQPRLNYDISNGVVQSCPSLLLEPASTNLVTDYLGSSWATFNGASITANDSTSPEGVVNATNIIYGGTANELIQKSSITITSGVTYTISGYFKLKSGSLSSSNNDFKGLDGLNGGSIGSSTFNTINNTWKRFSFSSTSSTTSGRIQIKCEDSAEILIYGLQLEEQSYATSVIPTNGSSQTRAAETCFGAGTSSTFNSTEGVLYAEIAGENDGTFNYISLSDGGTTNYAGILYTDTNNEITYRYYIGGSGVQIIISGINVTNFNKIAVKWKVNDFAIWINGVEVGSASSGAVHSSGVFDNLSFARGGSNNTPFYGNTKDIRVYNEALTDAQLQTLTT